MTRIAFCAALLLATRATTAPPNLVLLLADDLRWDALGCAGNPVVKTPHIDALAAGGVTFRNGFVTTSICCVSRASIFSGQYARRHGIDDFVKPFAADRWAETYPALLRKAGYRTGFVGKFGVGRDVKPLAAAFDYWRGLPGQGGPFFDPKDATKTHATARQGGQALEFLDGCTAGQPFCLSLSFTAPHARDGQPREFPPDARDEALYADAAIPVPPTATEAFFRALPPSVQTSEGRRRWEKRFATPEMWQATVRDYYRLVAGIDREVGRVVAKLRERGLADNTLVIFTSDNGFFFGERGMADKWLMYEESIRVPLIAFDPRLPPARRGATVGAMALNIDLAPTLLDAAGVAVPPRVQGRSLLPLARGERPDWRTEWLYEHHTLANMLPPSEGVRTKRYAYLRWVGVEPAVEELYDVAADPLEATNLAARPDHAAQLAELRGRWQALGRESH